MTGIVLALAGLTCGDGGPGVVAAREAAAVDFSTGEWKGEGWTDDDGPWSLFISDGSLVGYRVTPQAGRCSSEMFFLHELAATGGALRFGPYSSPPSSARLTYRLEGRRLIICGGGCLFILCPAAPRKP
jgi:hypothetical protein